MEGAEWSQDLGTHRSLPAPQRCLGRSALRPARGKTLLLGGKCFLQWLLRAFKSVCLLVGHQAGLQSVGRQRSWRKPSWCLAPRPPLIQLHSAPWSQVPPGEDKTSEMVGLGLNLPPDPLAPPSSSATLLPRSSSTEARGAGVGSRNHEPLGSVLMMFMLPMKPARPGGQERKQ